jgi:hypothetical protein
MALRQVGVEGPREIGVLNYYISDILPRPGHKTRQEIFGYRSGIELELVVAWDLNIISPDTRSCVQLNSHYSTDFLPESLISREYRLALLVKTSNILSNKTPAFNTPKRTKTPPF